MIQSADGAWVDHQGSSRGLSSSFDLQWMLWNRANADALLVSAKTAKSENYRVSEFRSEYQTFRASHNLPEKLAIATITSQQNLALEMLEQGFLVITLGKFDFEHEQLIPVHSLAQAIAKLNERGYFRIVCEGGPALANSLCEENLVDEFALTQSPHPAAQTGTYQALSTFLSSHQARMSFEHEGFTFSIYGTIPTWDEQLNSLEYQVLRHAATEPAYSASYETVAAPGYYTCRACGNKLFDATTQFDSHCGWPAFWRPSETDSVLLELDTSYGMRRIEVKCKACLSHLGHVFEGEGFGYPTDQRYCINRITLIRHP